MRGATAALVVCALRAPAAAAWGPLTHQWVTQKMIDAAGLLPPPYDAIDIPSYTAAASSPDAYMTMKPPGMKSDNGPLHYLTFAGWCLQQALAEPKNASSSFDPASWCLGYGAHLAEDQYVHSPGGFSPVNGSAPDHSPTGVGPADSRFEQAVDAVVYYNCTLKRTCPGSGIGQNPLVVPFVDQADVGAADVIAFMQRATQRWIDAGGSAPCPGGLASCPGWAAAPALGAYADRRLYWDGLQDGESALFIAQEGSYWDTVRERFQWNGTCADPGKCTKEEMTSEFVRAQGCSAELAAFWMKEVAGGTGPEAAHQATLVKNAELQTSARCAAPPPAPPGDRFHCDKATNTCAAAYDGHSTIEKCQEACGGGAPAAAETLYTCRRPAPGAPPRCAAAAGGVGKRACDAACGDVSDYPDRPALAMWQRAG